MRARRKMCWAQFILHLHLRKIRTIKDRLCLNKIAQSGMFNKTSKCVRLVLMQISVHSLKVVRRRMKTMMMMKLIQIKKRSPTVPAEECVMLTLLETLSSSCANMFPCHRASCYRLHCAQKVLQQVCTHFLKKEKKRNSNLLHHRSFFITDSFRNTQQFEKRRKKLNVNYRDMVKVKRRLDLFWVNYHFNFIPWQLQHLPLNWWKANRIVCSDLTFSSKAFECDSALMNLCSSVIPSWRCTAGSQDWQLCYAHTRANAQPNGREIKPK